MVSTNSGTPLLRSTGTFAATGNPTEKVNFQDQPYLRLLQNLEPAFPTLKGFLKKIQNADAGRKFVCEFYQHHHGRVPGRCYGLQFNDDSVSHIEGYPEGFSSPQALRQYLTDRPAAISRENNQRRLFILEDMEPDYVDALGHHLGVDPLVFCEQMNTWNFTDSRSIPHRGLPSLTSPKQSFTMRYYEIRTLSDPKSVDPLNFQMTFAVNRRKYERWRNADLTSNSSKDNINAFIRRCASFWSSQGGNSDEKSQGWDAVILVDPGMSAAKTKADYNLILQDPKKHENRASLWNAHTWEKSEDVKATEHKCSPYHGGCHTITPPGFSHINARAQDKLQCLQNQRDLESPFDEMIFYWTKVARKNLIESVSKDPSNVTYFLLKHIAQHWINQLELINYTLANGEYFSDDYQAKIDDTLSGQQWMSDLIDVTAITKDINYIRRQMNHFWRATILNLERLGIQIGCEQVDPTLSEAIAIQDAQKDFLNIHTRMQILRQRVEALTDIANQLANLRAAFKSTYDGELGSRLSVFASVVFPFTLVATILSMNDSFIPGKGNFWVFWASSIPSVAVASFMLLYGPNRMVRDLKRIIASRQEHKGAEGSSSNFVSSNAEV